MLKLHHNLRRQPSAFLYFWYTICVAGMASDIFSKDNFLRVGMMNRQHLPIAVTTIQEKKKSYFSEHSMTIQLKSTNNSLRLCFITLTWKFMTYTL